MNRNQFKGLDEAIVNLSRLLQSGESKLAHDRRFCEALRELKNYRRSGKRPPRHIHRAVDLICQVVCETHLKSAEETR